MSLARLVPLTALALLACGEKPEPATLPVVVEEKPKEEDPGPPPEGSVSLQFDWTTRSATRTRNIQHTRQERGAEPATWSWMSKTQVTVTQREDHVSIAHAALPSIPPVFEGEHDQVARATTSATLYAALLPTDLHVSRAGEMLAYEGLEEMVAQMQQGLRDTTQELEALDTTPREVARARAVLDSLSPKSLAESMHSEAKQDWDAMVGSWSGMHLIPGVPVELKEQHQHPMAAPTERLTVDVTLTLVGEVPCHDGAAADSCVRLRREARQDGRRLAMFAGRELQQELADVLDIPPFGIRKASHVTTWDITAEPQTLRIWNTERREETSKTVAIGEDLQTIETTLVDTQAYAWDAAP
jgi:hypothetical protein